MFRPGEVIGGVFAGGAACVLCLICFIAFYPGSYMCIYRNRCKTARTSSRSFLKVLSFLVVILILLSFSAAYPFLIAPDLRKLEGGGLQSSTGSNCWYQCPPCPSNTVYVKRQSAAISRDRDLRQTLRQKKKELRQCRRRARRARRARTEG